ncbi:fimbrial protein [Paraburkholderia sp. LEh10]|uniref:fimbrial protein n=1 Tax=Paraburkholderia sp. LEh10 TaxID=2821353 RepID=UPI001AE2B647|nr:fimbrial protein [Paraburkholderia sp. LEh10]MBP0592722.1 fimbrial protein [Paraburkholderia sp. LEh10]
MNISSKLRRLLLVFCVLILTIGFSTHAQADCTTSTGLPTTFTYGAVAVGNAVAVGDAIPGTVQSFHIVGKCTSSATFSKPVVACLNSGTPVAGMTGVYPTSIAGVGVRMRDSGGNPMVGTGACSTTSSLGNTGADGSFDVSGSVELVKTGAVGSGTMSSIVYYTGVLNTGFTLNNGANTMTVASAPIRAVTCSVTAATANQTIPLATVSPAMFPAAGTVAAKTPFSLGLNCQTGVKVSVTFNSTSGTTGVASVLGNLGTATGIGVQLLDSSQAPLVLGNPLVLTSSTTGNMSFPFYVQYYRLGAAPVVSGTVRATAIFTMSYQ